MNFKRLSLAASSLVVGTTMILPTAALAVNSNTSPVASTGLALQVSPSPIVVTVKPSEQKLAEVKIYNAGSSTENLKLTLESITVSKSNSRVSIEPTVPPEVAGWVSFSKPQFSLRAGERISEKILIDTPATAGFSYSFAIIVSRQVSPKAPEGQSTLVGSVAIFTLLDIDRPGATRKLNITSLQSSHNIYEYLPVNLTLKLKNEGNTLLLPAGNIYIQRQANSNYPLGVLAVNPNGLYLLPGVEREYQVSWNDGLPREVTSQDAVNATPHQHLEWNWRSSHFRIGRYAAKVIAIYNDGMRDVPVEANVSFWVLPWKIIVGLIVAAVVLIIGLVATARFVIRAFKRNRFKYRA